ncbi:hypothetical protein BU16DRAFT_541378 [Lophium mytilinum]|uniref:Uncharacterized protein n=1 Tax=Lophium mytilinum TaxID=390894 RepID=A0A6A6QKC3_9PEZI|nr:hypothetical protein BU16DRAFT_541378 [Lophium mytilinum]
MSKMPDKSIPTICVTDPGGLTREAAEVEEMINTPRVTAERAIWTWNQANTIYVKAQQDLKSGAQCFLDAKQYIPSDFAGHPNHQKSNPTATRASEIAELYKKASTVMIVASATLRSALKGFQQAFKLFQEALKDMPRVHVEMCERTTTSAREQYNEAQELLLPVNAEVKKLHVLAMAWDAQAHAFAKTERNGQDD